MDSNTSGGDTSPKRKRVNELWHIHSLALRARIYII
jgi:hypothetical protein